MLDAFLQQNVAIGADLTNVKKFYQEHSKIQNDLKVKEMDALAAFSTLPAVLSIGGIYIHQFNSVLMTEF